MSDARTEVVPHASAPRRSRATALVGADDLRRLWDVAPALDGSRGWRAWRWRLRYLGAGWRHRAAMRPLLEPRGILAVAVERRPEILGVVAWPYVCRHWTVARRVAAIAAHWAAVDAGLKVLRVLPDEEHELVSLDEVAPGLRLVLDAPRWFMREGQAVLNLFLGDTRVYSLAFSIDSDAGARIAVIGAIQGRDLEDALDIYRNLTAALHGMRPRDFLFDAFRFLCAALGVEQVWAVSDSSRHHRDRYFGATEETRFASNYDEIWEDRGGTRASPDFFAFPVTPSRRPMDEIPSKKRSMYRKRYAMLDDVAARIIRASHADAHARAAADRSTSDV